MKSFRGLEAVGCGHLIGTVDWGQRAAVILKILKSLFRLPPECPMAHSKGGGKRKILIQTR